MVTILTPLTSKKKSPEIPLPKKVVIFKGSIGHAFTVCIHTENQNQINFYPFIQHKISVLIEFILGHLCYYLTDVPPQPNSQTKIFSNHNSKYIKYLLNQKYITYKLYDTIKSLDK